MKLAEALVQRKGLREHIHRLEIRLAACAQLQEGDAPPEDPADLRKDLDRAMAEMEALVVRINSTNVQAAIPGFSSIMEAIARRDSLMTRQRILRNICEQSRVVVGRHLRSEIKYVTLYDVGALEREIDALARECRELDTRIQEANWTVELLD